MKESLLISDVFYYKIDSLFYQKNNITHIDIDIFNEHESLLNYKNIVVLLSDLMFDSIAKTSKPLDVSKHSNNYILSNKKSFLENFTNFYKKFPENTKFVLYDNNPEIPMKTISKFILEWLDMSSTNYLVSSRFDNINHIRALIGLTYLPLFFSFFQQNFNKYPKLDYGRPSITDYDFITFLGHVEKEDKIEFRLNFLKEIFKGDITQIKYEKDSEDKLGLKHFQQPASCGHEWNLLQSLSVKIQLIFETINPLKEYHDEYYFSEKTMKLFLLPHPYFLMVHGTALSRLEDFGFQFPFKCYTLEDYHMIIDNISKNVDEWVNLNYKYFYHNQIQFYKMLNSVNLKHHLFLDSIFKV